MRVVAITGASAGIGRATALWLARGGAAVTRAFGPRQHVDTVAAAIARGIDNPVAEVYPHAISRGLAIFNALAPGWCDRFVQRFGRKPAR